MKNKTLNLRHLLGLKKINQLILKLMAATCLKKINLYWVKFITVIWELWRPAAGPLGEECGPVLVLYGILADQQS